MALACSFSIINQKMSRPVINPFAEYPAYGHVRALIKFRARRHRREELRKQVWSQAVKGELDQLKREDQEYNACVERHRRITELNKLVHKSGTNMDAVRRYRREQAELRKLQIAYRDAEAKA
jgi:hypothetical protein